MTDFDLITKMSTNFDLRTKYFTFNPSLDITIQNLNLHNQYYDKFCTENQNCNRF